MSLLTPDLGLLFWMLLSFLIVFGALAKFGFPIKKQNVIYKLYFLFCHFFSYKKRQI